MPRRAEGQLVAALSRCAGLLVLCYLSWLSPAWADITAGLAWLTAQQQSDGRYAGAADQATAFQATAEALHTFYALGQSAQPGIPAAWQFLAAEPFANTEYLARRILATVEAGGDAAALHHTLLSHQNADGGFGELAGYESTVLDSAWALQALAASGAAASEVAGTALGYLLDQQTAEGGWSDGRNAPSVPLTALVVAAMQRFRLAFNLTASLTAATNYLYSQQAPGGGWTTPWETALALLAVVPLSPDASRYAAAVQHLRAAQGAEGSWGDVYTTALALRALHLVATIQFPSDPMQGTFTGRVIAEATGLPLVGVIVTLDETAAVQTSTQADGRFTLAGVAPGQYTVRYQAGGYREVAQRAAVQAAQVVDLGLIRLSALPTVGFITGIVTDAGTGQPLAGAQIQAVSATTVSTHTDSRGLFSLSLAPGAVTVSASAVGYEPVSGTGTLVAGDTLHFSPALPRTGTPPPGPQVTLSGRVVDSATQTPLAGVQVEVLGTGHQALTDSAGAFTLSGLAAGELTVELSHAGYQSLRFTALAPPGSQWDAGTVDLTRSEPLNTTTVFGLVVDAETGEPLGGATLGIAGSAQTVLSASDGTFRLDGIAALQFTVIAQASGYLGLAQTVTVTQPGAVSLTLQLQPAAVAGLAIINLRADSLSYPAYANAVLEAQFRNAGATAVALQLVMNVRTGQGQAIETLPAIHSDLPDEISDSILTVHPGEPLTTAFIWPTGRHPPGTYLLTLQAYDRDSLQLLAERAVLVAVEPTAALGQITLFAMPGFTYVGASLPVDLKATIDNRSNVPVQFTLAYAWHQPTGSVLRTGTAEITLPPDTAKTLVTLESFSHTFATSGEYPAQAQVTAGPVPGRLIANSIFVAPGTRIDPSQSLTPSTVAPVGEPRIQIRIQLQGREER